MVILQAWLTTISLALCKVRLLNILGTILFLSYYCYCLFKLLLVNTIQAFDLMEMLKKEEEMLSAIKEKQLQVLTFLL